MVLLQESKIDDVSDALVCSIFYWRNFRGVAKFFEGASGGIIILWDSAKWCWIN